MKERLRVPPDLRTRLETARLDLLALFRALDRLTLTKAEIPQDELHKLFELDADFAEALLVLDNPPPGIMVDAMVSDTADSLKALPEARETFLNLLSDSSRRPLAVLESDIRQNLSKKAAYHSIPGRHPQNR